MAQSFEAEGLNQGFSLSLPFSLNIIIVVYLLFAGNSSVPGWIKCVTVATAFVDAHSHIRRPHLKGVMLGHLTQTEVTIMFRKHCPVEHSQEEMRPFSNNVYVSCGSFDTKGPNACQEFILTPQSSLGWWHQAEWIHAVDAKLFPRHQLVSPQPGNCWTGWSFSTLYSSRLWWRCPFCSTNCLVSWQKWNPP